MQGQAHFGQQTDVASKSMMRNRPKHTNDADKSQLSNSILGYYHSLPRERMGLLALLDDVKPS